jgi:fucose permease
MTIEGSVILFCFIGAAVAVVVFIVAVLWYTGGKTKGFDRED